MTVLIVVGAAIALMTLLKWLTRDPWGKALISETWGLIVITLAGREYRQQAKAILRRRR